MLRPPRKTCKGRFGNQLHEQILVVPENTFTLYNEEVKTSRNYQEFCHGKRASVLVAHCPNNGFYVQQKPGKKLTLPSYVNSVVLTQCWDKRRTSYKKMIA